MSDPVRRRPSGLGRGLSALLGDTVREQSFVEADARSTGVQMLAVASIQPHPGQPRRHFDEDALDDLAASIAARGLIQPIVVRRSGDTWQIVAGERRWRAAQRARLHEVPVIVRDFTDAETLEVALVENIQREDLNAIEEAEAYQRLALEFGHTHEALGRLVNKSRSHIANLLRLLDLPEPVRRSVAEGALTMGHARALITAVDPEALSTEVLRRNLSVRDTERLARDRRPGGERKRREATSSNNDADIMALERHLGDLLGLTVRIDDDHSKGTVTLGYGSLDQLDMICQRLSGEPI